MGLLPAASRTKRLLWAIVGGYGLFLHAAFVHRQHLWVETSPGPAAATADASTTTTSSGSGSGDAITSLLSRALLRKHQPDAPQAAAAPAEAVTQPQYEAQAFPLVASGAEARRRRAPAVDGGSESEEGEGEAAEPPITSPASAFWQAEAARVRDEPHFARAVSTEGARPLRTAGEMGRAQECFRRREGYAYLVHMRKAGGALVVWLVVGCWWSRVCVCVCVWCCLGGESMDGRPGAPPPPAAARCAHDTCCCCCCC